MKKYFVLFLLSSTALIKCTTDNDGDIVIDEIKAIVQDAAQTKVITASDVTRRDFDGATHNVQDLVTETAKDLRAGRLGVSIETEDVDRYLRAMANEDTDMSKEALTKMALEHGYETLDEFYDDLKRLYRANTTMDQEIKSQLAVSEQEARTYYNAHPQHKDKVYYLQTTLIPFSDHMSKEELKKTLEDPEKRASAATIDWQAPFDITENELAQDKSFIKTMHIGDVHVVETENGFMLYKLKNLIDKHLVSFEERRKDIIKTLREEKFTQAYQKYNNQVLADASVTYCP